MLAVSGGFRVTVGGFRISARSPLTPSLAALAAFVAWWVLARRAAQTTRDLAGVWSAVERYASTIVTGFALASAGLAVGFGSFAAAGADASGYLSQAALWASGHLVVNDTTASIAGWPAEAGISAPLGWRPAATPGWQAPTYGPGLPLLMVIPYMVGGAMAACLVVAAVSAIAVWATGALAIRVAGGAAGIIAAITLAACPVFLHLSIQPMSDVPVTAAWMVCWVLLAREPGSGNRQTAHGGASAHRIANVLLAGVACAVAVLIRPNLAPLAIVPFAHAVIASRTPAPPHPRTPAPPHLRTFAPIISFALPVALAGLFLAWIQWQWYGSPLRSGYGTAAELFALSNIVPNATRYLTWLVDTASLFLAAPLGLFLVRRRQPAWWLAAFAALVVSAYLVYFVFDDWSYLRFLLPALAVGAVFVGVAGAAIISRIPIAVRAVTLFAMVLAIAAFGFARARALDTFQLADQNERVSQVGGYLNSALPVSAVVVSGEESGAVRFATGRPILRWEAASPDDFARAIAALEVSGRPVWILLDAWEEPLFRAKFAGHPAAALDWPPAVDAGETHRTRAWNVSDRERFLKGERVTTDRLR